ncbi:MAG TPA: hypothetical protein VGM51_14840 [Armatimonadota bacterium]|jgi:trehalose/maltose hydrolase-like predicted phosphorylase
MDYEFDGWRLRETEWKPEEETSRATVFALANGYMGSRGAFEEADPTVPGIVGNYINGIYDTPKGKLTEREIVNIPDWHYITMDVDGERFDMTTGEVLDYWRELDMREGILRRHVRWKSPAGKVVTIDTERFLSTVTPNVAGLMYFITVEQSCDVKVTSEIRADVNNRWADHTARFIPSAYLNGLSASIETTDPGYEIAVATSLWARKAIRSRAKHQRMSAQRTIVACLRPERTLGLEIMAAFADSRFTVGRPLHGAREMATWAREQGYDDLKAEHVARWAELWDNSDVVIEGDDEAQLGIRFSVFHLLAASPWWSDRVSIPARGLQGQDYYGSIFWDCEIFCLPMLMASQPAPVRNALGYRYHTLNGARRKANNYGFDGAFYAWQSQETGDDQCALYVFTNPFTGRPMRAPFSDQQIHISADIVYALWQYYLATGDLDFIRERGLEIAVEVANFFASRAERDPDGSYHLRGVLGPDEYHEAVDDDAYTNALARFALDVAIKFAELLPPSTPAPLPGGVGRQSPLSPGERGLGGEGDLWRTIRDALYIPQPDVDGVIEQFAGYFGLEDCAVDVARARLAHPDLHPGGPLGPFQSTQIIKQADVVMMLYLLRDQFSEEVKRANWEYYEKRTAHDSSLSAMAYSLVAAELGMMDWAYEYFIRTSHVDLDSYGPHWNLGIHAAGLGGAWQALVHGFCRIERGLDALVIRDFPKLPEQWTEVRFQFIHLGQRFALTVRHEAMEIKHLGGIQRRNAEPFAITFRDERTEHATKSTVTLAR